MHVELIPVTEPPSGEQLTAAREAMRVAKYSGNVADIEAANRIAESAQGARSWLARIDGGDAIPVLDYAISADDGRAVLNLVVPIDSLQIGDPSLVYESPPLRPATPEKAQPSTWGAPGKPDPRENLPGWRPEKLGEQVAQNAGQRLQVHWQPSAQQEIVPAVRQLIRNHLGRGGNGTAGVLA